MTVAPALLRAIPQHQMQPPLRTPQTHHTLSLSHSQPVGADSVRFGMAGGGNIEVLQDLQYTPAELPQDKNFFKGKKLVNVRFKPTKIIIELDPISLRDYSFEGTEFVNTKFRKADLTGTNFTGYKGTPVFEDCQYHHAGPAPSGLPADTVQQFYRASESPIYS